MNKALICTECNKNVSVHGHFCDSCYKETKICRRCQQRKSIFEFEKNQKSIAGKVSRRGECRVCRKWKLSIANKVRREFEKINLPPPLGEPFHCPVCDHTIIRQFKNDVVLDHSHTTGEIRGWLCRMCNNSIGMMNDDVPTLKRAIRWLEGSLQK